MQNYSGDPRFAAGLVPSCQCSGTQQEAVDDPAWSAPGSRSPVTASAADRTSSTGGAPWPVWSNGLGHSSLPNPVVVNTPSGPGRGESSGENDDGYPAAVVFIEPHGSSDDWTEPPPGSHNIGASWVQRPRPA